MGIECGRAEELEVGVGARQDAVGRGVRLQPVGGAGARKGRWDKRRWRTDGGGVEIWVRR